MAGAVDIDPLARRRRRGRPDRYDRELAERRRVSLKRKVRSDIVKRNVLGRAALARQSTKNFRFGIGERESQREQ